MYLCGVTISPPGSRMKYNIDFRQNEFTLQGTKEQYTIEWSNVLDWAVVPFSMTETSLVVYLDSPLKTGKTSFRIIRILCKDKAMAEVSFNDNQSIFNDAWSDIQQKVGELDVKNQQEVLSVVFERMVGLPCETN